MIKHIVLWKLDSSYSITEKTEILETFKTKLVWLSDKVPQLKSLSVNVNTATADAANYDIVLETTFENMSDLNAYQVHPNHLVVVDYVKSLKRQRACIDYEF